MVCIKYYKKNIYKNMWECNYKIYKSGMIFKLFEIGFY